LRDLSRFSSLYKQLNKLYIPRIVDRFHPQMGASPQENPKTGYCGWGCTSRVVVHIGMNLATELSSMMKCTLHVASFVMGSARQSSSENSYENCYSIN
jgi:hypothetical protein